jgi:hypothetical protein
MQRSLTASAALAILMSPLRRMLILALGPWLEPRESRGLAFEATVLQRAIRRFVGWMRRQAGYEQHHVRELR